MNELQAILDAWRIARDEKNDIVLATVVHVTGSAYRRPGARMLIRSDGTRVGSISGGCLEGDVSQKAWWLTENGKPALRVYDTMSEEDIVWEFGLGCNGIIQVLLERLGSGDALAAMEFLNRCREERADAVVCTVIRTAAGNSPQVGDRLFSSAGKTCGGTIANTTLETSLLPHCEQTALERKSRLVHLENCEVFVEWVGQPVSLVIFGAGHDAIPLVNIAKQIGWHVTVADGRPGYANASRFPGADGVVLIRPDDPLAGLDIGPRTAVVLMTHNYPQDGKLLQRILPLAPRYLGILGPKARTERLFKELGKSIDESSLNAPVGLDIGADTPESIALSIASEIQAVFSNREGSMLKKCDNPIHAPVIVEGVSSIPEAERVRFEFGCELSSNST
jgi:xanthine dehydrogenase accessory factor